MFHIIGMGFAGSMSNSKVVDGLAEMRIVTIFRRAEPARFAASTLQVAYIWSPTIASSGVVETSLFQQPVKQSD
jgi:hypothetical protein